MTTNKHWLYLEDLRRSGVTNMFGASPYLAKEFDLDAKEADLILADWMRNYNPDDYEDEDEAYDAAEDYWRAHHK